MKNKKTPIDPFATLYHSLTYLTEGKSVIEINAMLADVMDRYDNIGLVGQSLLFRLLDDYYDYKNGIKLGWCASDPKIHSNYKNRILAARQQAKEETIAGSNLMRLTFEGMTNLLERRKDNV